MIQTAFILLFFSVIFCSFRDLLNKRCLREISSNSLIFIFAGFSVLVLTPLVWYLNEFPENLSEKFIIVLLLSGTLYYIGKFFNFKANKHDEVSYILPFRGLISVIVLVNAIFLLGEIPTPFGVLGVFLIVLGIYFLAVQKEHVTIVDTFRSLVTRKGSRYYLITVACYGFTVTFDKMGILESSPLFWALVMSMMLLVFSSAPFFKRCKEELSLYKKEAKFLGLFLIVSALEIWLYYFAIQDVFASYTSALRTSSFLLTIILSGYFLKEQDILKKLGSGVLIVFGCSVLYFSDK